MTEEFITIKKDAFLTVDPSFDTRYIVLVAGNIKGSLTVNLSDVKRQIDVIGLVFGKTEAIDFSFIVRHLSKDTKSIVQVTAFAAESADILVKNDIQIERHSFGSSTDVTLRTLRLSDESRVRSLPILHMDHENLTASHAAIIDGYEKKSLQYLMSRGISIGDAKKILAFGMFRAKAENVSDHTIRQTLYNEWNLFV